MKEKLTVLVIDDNPDDCMLYQRELHKAFGRDGVEIMQAGSGDKGLESVTKYRPACVLLDYSLPGRNGIEVLKNIRRQYPHLPVIMLTGQGNEHVAVECMKLRAQDYITKSQISADALKRLVSMAIEHAELQKRVQEQQTALEIFTRALAHDLKEPMRTISSFTEMILKNRQLPEKEDRYFSFIQKASARMTMLINTVFLYTQIDGFRKVEKETFCMNEAVAEACENLAQIIQEYGTQIVADPLPSIHACRVQMLQLWQNLIANAIRHCGKDVKIHISAEELPDEWQFSVADNGPGIAPQHLETIFAPFKRLSEAKEEGSGLGLAICRKAVELHQGRIWCTSGPGRGATFLFTLPKVQPDSASARPVIVTEDVAKMHMDDGKELASMLLVDDRKSDIELARIILIESINLACNMMIAGNGSEALSILQREKSEGRNVDLVLLDINMPGMDGFELLEIMRKDEEMKNTSVIMFTGSTYEKDRKRAESLGAIGYMAKPPVLEDMHALLKRVPSIELCQTETGYALQRVG